LITKYEQFFRSLPVQAGDFSPRLFVENLPVMISARARCRSNEMLQIGQYLEHLGVVQLEEAKANDIAARAEEQVFVACRAKTPAASVGSQRQQLPQMGLADTAAPAEALS
jgi:hypothetical protein